MKNTLKFIGIMLVMMTLSTNIFAQVTVSANANASATIIAPLTIAWSADMNFGNLAVLGATAGTCVLGPDDSRLATGGVDLAATTAGVVSAAAFDLVGSEGYVVVITLPQTACVVTSGANTMNVDTWISDPPAPTLTFSGTTMRTLLVGATLNVGASQAPGLYTSATPFVVTASYQ
jgi:hypothetical protein